MPGRAPGLRASDSVAEAVALPCPSAHRPDAMAIAKPEVIATQLVPAAASPPWANTGMAKHMKAITMNTMLSVLRIVFLLYDRRQWVVGVRPWENEALTLNSSR